MNQAVLFWLFGVLVVSAQELPRFDFTEAQQAREWGAPHDISRLTPTSEGLEIAINGHDPYFSGPARNYPAGTPLWALLKLKADQAGTGEIFYFQQHPDQNKAVQFPVPGQRWVEVRVPLPSLGEKHRLRFDPPGTGGKVILAQIRFEKRVNLAEPAWPDWTPADKATGAAVQSAPVQLSFSDKTPFGFEVIVNGELMAVAHPEPRIGYYRNNEVRWVRLDKPTLQQLSNGGQRLSCETWDEDGARWNYQQIFQPSRSGAIEVQTEVSATDDRSLLYVPTCLLLAGERSFEQHKNQGLLAGLEYLEDEPSSSEADIIGPESKRRTPAAHKLTFPLMAIQARDRYVGLISDEPRRFAALFDSPDRTFGSHGHLLGVIYPGSDGANREEGSLLPYAGEVLEARHLLKSRSWIIGGKGSNVLAAVQHYVRFRGMPQEPAPRPNVEEYLKMAARGWLDSKCREGALYRHAVWPGFKPQPAADAAVFESWLGVQPEGQKLREPLEEAAQRGISAVPNNAYYHSGVSHVRTPAAPLIFGGVRQAIEAAAQTARAQLSRFDRDGRIEYQPGAVDYAKTHSSREANGLTAQVVASLLEAAAFSGDPSLIRQALAKMSALEKFKNTVPRGAQTWEIPLHTPDILASAYLLRAYTLAYELSGEGDFLEQAKYWAWSGVPFVYLTNPTDQPVGRYATIAVLGATNWKAPVWFGRPVQWCGMVYAAALYRVALHDPSGPWKQLADGITSTAMQLTWPAEDRDRVGLLPDFYELGSQTRAGPAINPGTVGACAPELFVRRRIYDFRALLRSKALVHAPGSIHVEKEDENGAELAIDAWPSQPYSILIGGLMKNPVVQVSGKTVTAEYSGGSAVFRAEGRVVVNLRF